MTTLPDGPRPTEPVTHSPAGRRGVMGLLLLLLACSDGGPTDPGVDPAIGLSMSPTTLEVVAGQSATTTVSVSRSGDYDGAIALAVEGAPSGLTGTFAPASVANGSTSSTLTIAATTATAVGEHTLTVRASGSGVAAKTASVTVTVVEPPSISVAVDPAELTVEQGASGTVAVSVARTSFAGAVDLTIEGAAAGTTATFEPATVPAGSSTSTLTIALAADAPVGTGALTIRAVGEGVEDATVALTLGVTAAPPPPAYTLTVAPAELDVLQGDDGASTVTIARTNFDGEISLSVTGAPAGVVATVSPASTTANSAEIALNVGIDAAPGTHTLTLTGEAADLADRTATLELTIAELPGFALSIDPAATTVAQGGSASVTVGIARTGGLAADVALSASGGPTGLTVTFDPADAPGDEAEMTVEAAGDLAPGSYEVTVHGNAEALPGLAVEDEATLSVTVEAAIGGPWAQTSAGADHTCGVTSTGGAYCWGENSSGQLGTGDQTDQTRPAAVAGGHTWKAVSAGHSYTCGITTDGTAYCWGAGSRGQLGNGGTSAVTTTPVPVTISGGDEWASISAAAYHTCALTTDGRAYCWGVNNRGQLGDGGTVGQTTRVQVAGSHTWKSIRAGGWGFAGGTQVGHTCGVTTDDAAYCWGANPYGQLGDGNPGNAANSTPVPLAGGRSWESVTPGSTYTCGVEVGGDAYCWGDNGRGQLGTGNTTDQSTPTLVLNDHEWSKVVPGTYHPISSESPTTCGITRAGVAYCWGANSDGKVGNGNTSATQSSPALVAGDHEWAFVDPGGRHTCGHTVDGVAYCWGRGFSGQLGSGSTTQSFTPLAVADLPRPAPPTRRGMAPVP